MSTPEASVNRPSETSVLQAQTETKSRVVDMLLIGGGALLGASLAGHALVGAVVGGICGHIAYVLAHK